MNCFAHSKDMIINLTQHAATEEQRAAGVVDLTGDDLARLKQLLTFEELPKPGEVSDRASAIAELAMQYSPRAAMIGGAPYLMSALERALESACIVPLYAFSRRESVERQRPDGTVEKLSVFRHAGFICPPSW